MNIFMAEHWDINYKYITNCTIETPFVRKLRGGEAKFSDPQELIKYLKESKEASFMWTDCEDLMVLADMYQFRIKVITTKGATDKNVQERWIVPDPKLKEFAELQNVPIDDMILLHEDDLHFNLVVDKDSDLAMLGSLSYRFNVGPIMKEINEEEEIVIEHEENDDLSFKDVMKMIIFLKTRKMMKSRMNLV